MGSSRGDWRFQSTLPARGATPGVDRVVRSRVISIHAPREGSDLARGLCQAVDVLISIHAPREGSDLYCLNDVRGLVISIHAPREGSDIIHHSNTVARPNFNPRSPRGERPQNQRVLDHNLSISIHAPREGSDFSVIKVLARLFHVFQSTLPARGATANVHRFLDKICTVCIKNRAFFAQCLIQTTSNAESVGKTRCYFGANLQAFIDSLYFAQLQNQHFFWHIRGFASKMLYFVFVMVPKIIET